MKVVLVSFLTLLICHMNVAWSPGDSQPHIIFVLADDLGIYPYKFNLSSILPTFFVPLNNCLKKLSNLKKYLYDIKLL